MAIWAEPDPMIPPAAVPQCLRSWSPEGGPVELTLLGHLVTSVQSPCRAG